MNEILSENKCEACSLDAPVLTEQEINGLLPQIPSWIVHKEEGINRLICSFAFTNPDLDFTETDTSGFFLVLAP